MLPEPTVVPSASPEPTVVPSASPEPAETSGNRPGHPQGAEPDSPDSKEKSGNGGGASTAGPDFSACAGLTGRANAVCRHQALTQLHPGSRGLGNSLGHLQGNEHGSSLAHGGGAD
jgi:hypothetical protein